MNVLEMFLGTSGGLDAVINIAVYAVIVLLFIVGIVRCIAPISHTRATIRRAIRSIKQGATGKLLLAGGQVPRQGLPLPPLERIPEQPLLRRRRVPQRLQCRRLYQ